MRDPAPSRGFQDPRHQLGYDGEEAAITWFEERGWLLEAHRFRAGRNDLDLVVRKDHLVAFVEVKTRQGATHGQGREAIDWRKRQAIARVAEVWRLRYGRPDDLYRFDVIEVRPRAPGRRPAILHLPDAWRL
jgi:putative endonuclease